MKRKEVAVVVALAAAVLILYWGASRPPAGAFDDAFITYRYAANLRDGLGLRYNPGEWVLGTTAPLFALLLGGLGLLVADIAWLGHWVGILSWVGVAWAGMALFWQEGRPGAALVAGLLVAVQPAVLHSVGMETPFLLLLMLLVALAWFSGRKVLTVILAAALILTRQDSALWLLFLGLEVWRREGRLPWREGLATGLLTSPWFLFAAWRYGRILPNSALAKIGQTSRMPVEGLPPFWLGWLQTVTAGLAWPGMVALVAAVLGGLWAVWQAPRFWWLPAWVLAYGLFYTLVGAVTFPWYFVPPLLGVLMLAALGLGLLLGDGMTADQPERGRATWLRPLVALLLLLLLLVGYGREAVVAAGRQHGYQPAYVPAGRWLAENAPAGAQVATIEIGVLGYESQRPILDTMGLVSADMTDHQFGWQETLVYALHAHRPEYAVTLPNTAWDGLINEWWFQAQYWPAATFDNVTIYERRPEPATQQITPVNADLANGLTVTEFTIADPMLRPGETLDVTVGLSVSEPQSSDYLFTLYLVDAQTFEQQAVQRVEPFAGRYPGRLWQPGDHFAVPVRLEIPATLPAGAYHLGVVVFDVTQERGLPWRDAPEGGPADIQAGWLRVGSPSAVEDIEGTERLVVDATWEEGMRLAAVGVPAGAAQPGADMPLQLAWAVEQNTQRDLTIFVHLVDEQEELVAQWDGRPFAGRWPTPVWQAGEQFTQTVIVPLPEMLPAGTYGLRIGLYDQEGRVALTAGAGGSVWLETAVEVAP